MKREKDKLRVLNEQIPLQQAKQGRAVTQIQKVVRSVGVREKYGYYKKSIKYGKSHNLQEVQNEKWKIW